MLYNSPIPYFKLSNCIIGDSPVSEDDNLVDVVGVQEINNAGYVVSKSSLRESAKETESQKRRGSFGRSKPTIFEETKRNGIPTVLKIESDFAHPFSVFSLQG